MAVTVTPDLTVISLANDNTGGTWAGASGAFDTEVKKQGAGSWFYQTPKNGNGDGNFTPTSAIDLSAADTHIYWWMKCDVFAFCEALNTGATSSGLMIKVESGASDYVTWHIAGSDTWGGEWKAFVIDVNNTANKFATVGTLNLAAVTKISFLTDNSNSGNIRIIDNTNVDGVRFGTGLTLTGTDFNLLDAALDDELDANKYGVLEVIDGNVHCQGRIIIGNGATTTTFNSTDEVLIFKDDIVSTALYRLNFVGSGNVSVIKGLVSKSAGTSDMARHTIDASDSATDLTMSGSTFIRGELIELTSTADVQNCAFNNCHQITPSTSIFKTNTISNFVGTDGALLWPTDDSNISDITFLLCDNDIEYDATSDSTPTFVNILHDDNAGDFDVNNTSGASVTIPLTGTSNGNSSQGSAVTFSASVTLTFTVKDEAGVGIEDARINILNASTKAELYQIATNASGIATQSHTYSGDLGIQGWTRQFDLTGTDYVAQDFTGTITSTGFNLNVVLIEI